MTSEGKVLAKIDPAGMKIEEFEKRLHSHLTVDELSFERDETYAQHRSVDPSVVVALVGAGGATLTALITGILAIGRERRARNIVVKSGEVSIDMPVDAPLEKVQKIVEMMQKSRSASITFLRPPWEVDR